MSKARLKQMLLQTDMFLEHQYSTGWAEGERKKQHKPKVTGQHKKDPAELKPNVLHEP